METTLDDLPTFQHCCCCISLQTGATIISLLTMTLPEFILCGKIWFWSSEAPYIDYEWRQELKVTMMDIILAIMAPFIGVILLVGIFKKSHSYLLSYLCITIFMMVVFGLDIFLDSFAHPWVNLVEFFVLIIYGYFWLCIQSLFQRYKLLDPDYRYLLA